ncbi:MAG: adenylyltransferase/cytidyltransferase family protein [Ruminococcus sp.]|jgi:[citrate (pro-3S)-lyase] ligase|nr:adenylyltransferase/cytidyltransferase family protein [Ruminococcus sp.]
MNEENTILQNLVNELHKTRDFRVYLRILKEVSKYAAVAVVSADTPWGPDFTEEDAKSVQDLGFKVNLYRKFRCSYVGVVFSGEVLLEKIDYEFVEETILINDFPITLRSGNNEIEQKVSSVSINGINHRPNRRGLTFYVISLTEKKAVSAIGFDTFSKNKIRFQFIPPKTYLQKFAENNSDVTVITAYCPSYDSLSPSLYTEYEKSIKENSIDLEKSATIGILNDYFSTFELRKSVITAPPSYRDVFGVRKFYDFESELVNCKNGIRVTPGAPETYKRAVYIAGGCGICGVGAQDSGTIAAHLQKLLNEQCPEEGFAVFNYGYYLADDPNNDDHFEDFGFDEVSIIVNFLPVVPGDIVIAMDNCKRTEEFIDCRNVTRPYKYGDIFLDNMHLTEAGYREVADKLFEGFKKREFFADKTAKSPAIAKTPRRDKMNLSPDEAAQLKGYTDMLDNVSELLKIEATDNIGAIVMNCNPFTNGHRYLIETAAAQVKFLFVFAVQEDKSEFPFEERYELMQAATEDIENVYVLPSGQFIISSFTFKEYFNKKTLNTMAVNPSNDIRLFGGQIAPHLKIKTRFAGEEPLDPVTRQYNRQMEAILPQYGIRFAEIPRKETNGKVISASRVRELLKTRDFEAIAPLVPIQTLEYLKKKYG